MFINVIEELKKAREGGYALGAFNTSNLEMTKAICRAAEETNRPFIIQTSPSSVKYAGLHQIFDIVKNEVENTNTKSCIHLDHGKDFETARQCIDAGYRSVMMDASKLSFEENVALTKKLVDFAHSKNVAVEGEIGIIGTEEGGEISGLAVYSSPEEVAKFVELTGIDSVAVSVGNEHGAPDGERIHFEILEKISEIIKIPLVMHGASGLSDDDIKRAISLGVTKINIDTSLRRAFIDGMRDIAPECKDYREIFEKSILNVTSVVKRKMELFANGK